VSWLRGRPVGWATAYVVVAGAIVAWFAVALGVPPHADVGLDGEYNAWAAWSALLLLVAAVLAARTAPQLAALLFFLAADEGLKIHERLEGRTGIDWQIIYLPVFALGAFLMLSVMLSLRGAARVVLVLGGTCWVVSQVLERIEWAGDVLAHPGLVLPEEVLEASGSILFAAALMLAAAPSRTKLAS
jgi:hypothetical protein